MPSRNIVHFDVHTPILLEAIDMPCAHYRNGEPILMIILSGFREYKPLRPRMLPRHADASSATTSLILTLGVSPSTGRLRIQLVSTFLSVLRSAGTVPHVRFRRFVPDGFTLNEWVTP
jgi:hypothetical protein